MSNIETLIPFKKGQSGNPKGRPKGAMSFTNKVKEAINQIAKGNKKPESKLIIEAMLKKAKAGDPQILKLIWNYLDGLPTQRIEAEITGSLSLTDMFNSTKDTD